MKNAPKLTAERLREVLHYAPETGVFTWIRPTGHRAKAGQRAGATSKLGYELIGVDGVRYYAHRLAWLYMHGTWPAEQVDHRNLNRLDNRISNLRHASHALNNQNKLARVDNVSGRVGVHWHAAAGKWAAEIQAFNRRMHLGLHATIEAASAARKAAEEKYHPFAPTKATGHA